MASRVTNMNDLPAIIRIRPDLKATDILAYVTAGPGSYREGLQLCYDCAAKGIPLPFESGYVHPSLCEALRDDPA
jgi:hypothetical protein